MLALLSLAFPSVDVTNVLVTPINATTLQDLTCTWTVSGYTQYNISWYNNSVLFNTTVNASTITLSNVYTAKGEVWMCKVVAENVTEGLSVEDNSSTTIKNSAPSTPLLLNTTGQDIGNYEQILENLTYTFTIDSSDPDNVDSITYSLSKISGNNYCDLSGNIVTCTPYLQPTGTADQYMITAHDGLIGSLSFINLNVSPINDAPNFTSYLTNTLIYEGDLLSYPFTVTDEENASANFYYVTFVTSPSTTRLENYTTNFRDYTIRFIGNDAALYSDVGNYSINVSVCDPDDINHCTIRRFNLVVNTTNHQPNISAIQNYTGRQTQNFSFIVNATDIDSTDTLGFTISTISCAFSNPWIINTTNSSANATGAVNMTLNNTHMLCPNVTITVSDNRGGSSSVKVYFNLTNEDDYPVISNFSFYGINTQSNIDIRNLTAYTNAQFYYQINGSDPDSPIDPLETLTYTDNSSSCANCPVLVIQSGGLINMTFTDAGNFSYEINLTDASMNYTTAWMQITIINNSKPGFNQTPGNIIINETDNLLYVLNATDPEGIPVNFSSNSSLLNFTSLNSQGTANHTYYCDDIGNYSIRITITDGLGAQNHSDISLQIRNEPTQPNLPDFGNTTILEEILYYRNLAVEVIDSDYDCAKAGDSYTFVPVDINGNAFLSSSGLISFTPDQNLNGVYIFNVTVIDSYGLSSSKEWNLTIANLTNAPSIINITPYDIPLNTSWVAVSSLGVPYTNVNASENMTLYFDHNSTDSDGDPLFFNWTVNGQVVNYSRNYTRTFNFTDAGNYNITLAVSDNVSGTLAHKTVFTWNLTVENKNRQPDLANPLLDFNLSTVYRWSTYMTYSQGIIRFYDPDGDTLTYNNSPTTLLSIEYDGNDAIFTPITQGTQYVVFSASDGNEIYYSNNVTINITGVPNTTVVSVQETGTTTRTRTRTSYVPYIITEEKEVEKDIYLDILNPEPVVIYNNNTLRQVISLVNSGNKTLKGIWLSAITNSSTADISFSNNYLNELLIGETKKTDLIIKDYKIYNNYEITITANVTSPAYKDKAVIYINALEKTRGNQSVSATKITFASDLLASNPECIELNEYLKKALQLMEEKDYEGAAKITDSVIQGCKYLVGQSRLKDDAPGKIYIDMQKILDIPNIKIISAVLLSLIIILTVLTIRQKRMNDVLENM
ncbi:MAG: hypothetical protein ABIJ34_05085 [archaeon]